MPIHHALWKVGASPTSLATGRLESEQLLEEMIVREPGILSTEWMLIGRQEITTYGGRIDLLAVAPDGSLVLIELKRDKTPREITAQALDYASWVETLGAERLEQIYQRFSGGGSLTEAFRAHFGTDLDEESLNQSHQVIIVATALDNSSERIIGYLNARDIAINVVFFQVFEHEGHQLLSRAWLIDPIETQSNAATTTRGEREPWNGEFYASFGPLTSRSWSDAREYGFISAGGAPWYSRTLGLLSPGDRVWVKIPKTGYVGVARVTEASCRVDEFAVATPSGMRPALDVLEHGDSYRGHAEDEEQAEYFVRVEWLDTRSEDEALQEVGLFGNQNSVCQPTTPKWRHTIERLKANFPRWNT